MTREEHIRNMTTEDIAISLIEWDTDAHAYVTSDMKFFPAKMGVYSSLKENFSLALDHEIEWLKGEYCEDDDF